MADVPKVPESWDDEKFNIAYDTLKTDVKKETLANQEAVKKAEALLQQLGPTGDLSNKIKALDEWLKKIGSDKVDKGGVTKGREHYFDSTSGRTVGSLKTEMDALKKALESKMNKLTPYKRAGKTDMSSGDPWKDLNDLLARADKLRKRAQDDKAKERMASGSGVTFETKMKAIGASVTGMTAGVSAASVSLVATRLGVIGSKTGADLCDEIVCGAMESAARGFETALITARNAVQTMVDDVMATDNKTKALVTSMNSVINDLVKVKVGGVG